MRTIAIISCGAEKLDGAHRAADLYVGSYFLGNLKAALAVAESLENVYVLSAKYGLVPATQVIESYNVRMGDPGAVSAETIREQILALGLDETDGYVFAPRAYWEVIWSVGSGLYWAPQWVNEADAGIGYQKHTAFVVAAA